MSEYSQAISATPGKQPRATLVIAHPGHELRVHGWLETALPDVWVLTDGSGRTRRSRIDSTTRVLAATGAVAGPIYGQMSDADLYNAVLTFDHRRFTDLVDQLAASLINNRVNCIAGDAEEGYNPAHDICRLVINAASRLVNRKTKNQIANYEFALVGAPARCPDELRAKSLWLNLDEAALARKISAARNYPELQAEVEAALGGNGNETLREHSNLVERVDAKVSLPNVNNFQVECLRPANCQVRSNSSLKDQIPFYEEYGERQVKAGHYTQVLRYSEHMLPLVMALDSHVKERS